MRRGITLLSGLAAIWCMSATVRAEENPAEGSGLPVPRFVSLKSREANMRSGPGTRYPIRYVYQRPDLPLEIISEYDLWREVRDPDGESGWMHKSMLSGKRTAILRRQEVMRQQPSEESAVSARLAKDVIVHLEECSTGWCQIEVHEMHGWLPKPALWGVYTEEVIED